jgi:hypothetical protein
MPLDQTKSRQLLKQFDFRDLFLQELGWDNHKAALHITVDGEQQQLAAIAQKRGMVAYQCATPAGGSLPEYGVRRKIEQQVAKAAHEHLIIFTDAAQTTQIWQWVKREPGKPAACREHHFDKSQSGEALLQKLESIAFTLDEEETLVLTDVTRGVRAGFDLEQVTKKFFEQFKKEHTVFLGFIKGILKQLSDFASQEVQTRIQAAKDEVHNVRGGGTTWRQNETVSGFYNTVRRLLSAALREHLEKHFQSFAAGLIAQANSVYPQIKTELLSNLDERLKAIESTLALATTEQKTRVTNYLSEIIADLPDVGSEKAEKVESAGKEPVASPKPSVAPSAIPELKPHSYEIPDGKTGYGYDRVFGPYLAGAQTITVEDPYVRKRYQIDNFAHFCSLAISRGAVKHIILKTGAAFGEDLDDADSRLENLKRELAKNHGVKMEWTRSEKLHDREVIFSNGWTVKVGRGLDIYYPPESWSSVGVSNYSLRKCRQTKVDVLRRET